MKKYAFLTVALGVLAVPSAANADWFRKDPSYDRERLRTEMRTTDYDASDIRLRVDTMENAEGVLEKAKAQTLVFPLANGEDKVEIKGEAIYLIEANGNRYLAPNGPYTATNGITFVAENGLVIRAEEPDQIVYVDADLHDTDRDGYANTLDVDAGSRPAPVYHR